MLEQSLEEMQKKMARLQELNDWCYRAARELKAAPPSDPRWETYNTVKARAEQAEKEIEDLELQQEAALTEIVKANGPLVLEMEDGTLKTVAASPGDRGEGDPLLPRDLLSVWRVAKVFEGSIIMGGQPTRLQVGNPSQIATLRMNKKPKRGAVVGEETSLFGKD